MKRARRSNLIIVLVTCPTPAVGRRLARQLIARRLAACVNVVPRIESTFIWKGKMEQCRETLLLIKAPVVRWAQLHDAISTLHPYEVPEVLALPVKAGHGPYVEWVVSSTIPPRRRRPS